MKFGGDFRRYIWPMWGFFQNRGFYQYTSGYTTQFGFNDGSGSGLASLLLSLPSVKQRQAGIPQMDLRNWGGDAFAEDSWQFTSGTTVNLGLRYEYTSPLYDTRNTNTNLAFLNGVPSVFVGGQLGYPSGLMYPNKHNFAPRIGIAKNLPRAGLVLHAAYGIFYTPIDQNTWCNQRHNVPYVFPETQQADNFTPPAALFKSGMNFGTPVLGLGPHPATTVSFTAFDAHAPAQYVQQWNTQVEKSFGTNTTVEVGYLGTLAARRGDRGEAQQYADQLRALNTPHLFGQHTFWRARIAACLHDAASAVDLMRDAFGQGRPFGVDLHRDMDFESLQNDPAFRSLIDPKG